jgi:sulfur-oxidizing protein SoxX
LAARENRPLRAHCEGILTPFADAHSPDCEPMAFMLFTTYIAGYHVPETPLVDHRPMKSAVMLTLALLAGMAANPARAQSPVSEGQKLAFDRGKGNCLTCHDIKGGDLPGTIGPPLTDIKGKYPDRNDLIAILTDETKRNPLTVMPPFGRNRILTEQEINAIVDFLQTL